ncbi:MAG: leucyl/phenylalanyl-tRNA--protein transferase [Flavobacteriaceae bacterium]|nr:leucyl/phenylalanyl-tRNA--protein transferase [Flavobacteriaceae bacterium]
MRWLTTNLKFPPVDEATEDGLLAVGGDLSIERLVLAYRNGIFPWYSEESPILWWSPDPRFILFPKELKVSKSMRQFMRKSNLKITFNQDFDSVIEECAGMERPGQGGTWITDEMLNSYKQLHRRGIAKSVEAYENDILVAGLYGIDLGNGVFCGESMFTKKSNASKAAFIHFVKNSDYKIIDCQVYTPHLESLGAREIPRSKFLKYLKG